MTRSRTSRVLTLAAGLTLTLAACHTPPHDREVTVQGGDPETGQVRFLEYGCASCHAVQGVPSVREGVGQNLHDFSNRLYLAGQQPNRPEELIRWIQHPQHVVPGTLMPDLGVTDQDARDIAAFLYER